MNRCITALLAVALVTAGCGLDATVSGGSFAPTATPSKPPKTTSSWSANGIPPSPKPAAQRAYLAALNAIDPDIVHGKADKVIDRGRSQCSSIYKEPRDQAKLVKLTNYRFTSPDHPQGFGTAKSKRILKVVRKYICPDF